MIKYEVSLYREEVKRFAARSNPDKWMFDTEEEAINFAKSINLGSEYSLEWGSSPTGCKPKESRYVVDVFRCDCDEDGYVIDGDCIYSDSYGYEEYVKSDYE